MLNILLRKLREEKHLTQSEVAKTLKLNRVTYSRYEAGTREPDFATLINIAQYFNVSIDYLLGNENKTKRHHVKAVSDLIEIVETLEVPEQKQILGYAEKVQHDFQKSKKIVV